jgi:hypothetical protein
MAAPKLRTADLSKLYQQDADKLREKKIVESLIQRLNDLIQTKPGYDKKAALIIEQWLKKSKP